MKSRLLVAAVGVPLLLIVLLALPVCCTAVLVILLSAIAVNELLKTTNILTHKRMLIYSEIIAILIPVWNYSCNAEWCTPIWTHGVYPMLFACIIFVLYLFVMFCEALAAYPKVHFSGITAAVYAAVLIPCALSGIVRLQLIAHGRFYVLIPIMIPFIADAGAYFAGRACGKHKMAPVLSPHKTVEGAIGGLAAGFLSMIIYGLIIRFAFGYGFNFLYGCIYGVVGSFISVIGDLAFSMVKRETGIKDYGTIFKAHGGVLDRFDSVIFATPVIEILILLLPAIG